MRDSVRSLPAHRGRDPQQRRGCCRHRPRLHPEPLFSKVTLVIDDLPEDRHNQHNKEKKEHNNHNKERAMLFKKEVANNVKHVTEQHHQLTKDAAEIEQQISATRSTTTTSATPTATTTTTTTTAARTGTTMSRTTTTTTSTTATTTPSVTTTITVSLSCVGAALSLGLILLGSPKVRLHSLGRDLGVDSRRARYHHQRRGRAERAEFDKEVQ